MTGRYYMIRKKFFVPRREVSRAYTEGELIVSNFIYDWEFGDEVYPHDHKNDGDEEDV